MNYGIKRFDVGGGTGAHGDPGNPGAAPADGTGTGTGTVGDPGVGPGGPSGESNADTAKRIQNLLASADDSVFGLANYQPGAPFTFTGAPITTNTTPTPGGIYSFAPAAYQPVRYTPSYDQYGRGIASLFGTDYSRMFGPRGVGVSGDYGGDYGGGGRDITGGGRDITGGGRDITGGGRDITGGGRNDTITGGTGNDVIRRDVVTRPSGLTNEQFAYYAGLPENQRAAYLGAAGAYNAPGNVQSDAAALRAWMASNKYSITDTANLVGVSPQQLIAYLNQEGLDDAQLNRYQGLTNFADQAAYANFASALNRGTTPAEDAANVRYLMESGRYSVGDVARITGIPEAEVSAFLGMPANTGGGAATTIAAAPAPAPAPVPAPAPAASTRNEDVYNYVAANINDPAAIYNRMNEVGTNTAGLATALGIPESQVIQYFTDAGLMGRESP